MRSRELRETYLTGTEIEEILCSLPDVDFNDVIMFRMHLGIGEIPSTIEEIALRVDRAPLQVSERLRVLSRKICYRAHKTNR